MFAVKTGGKRVLEIAAVGGHNLLFCGPPGSGKSMLAKRLPGLLPPLSARELLDVSQIQFVSGLLERGQLSRQRPFRALHHSASIAAFVGGCGQAEAACRKAPRCAEQYQARLSGPFLDRIDLFFDTPPVTAVDLTLPPSAECRGGRGFAGEICDPERRWPRPTCGCGGQTVIVG